MRTLKKYRLLLGLTQVEMAEKIGITQSTYSRKERMPDKLSCGEVEKILDIIKEEYPAAKAEEIFFEKNMHKRIFLS